MHPLHLPSYLAVARGRVRLVARQAVACARAGARIAGDVALPPALVRGADATASVEHLALDAPVAGGARWAAVIAVRGALSRDGDVWDGFGDASSYAAIGAAVRAAAADPAVASVLLDVDSDGGELEGVPALCRVRC